MAEIRINATGGVKLYDADDSHYAQIVAGTITSNVDAITLGHDTVTIADNLSLGSDSAVLKFGADGDTTLTHTDGTGLTLNSTNKICFNDASQFVQGSSATVLSIGATDEIDLTATAIDINGTCDISGTFSLGGTNMTATATELNLLDGGTSVGSSITLADADGFIVNDGGTMKTIPASDISTYAGGGITEADQWRLTTDFTNASNGANEIITANWERNDTHFDKIGTGLTESSGVFSFPSTGIWLIQAQTYITLSSATSSAHMTIITTPDNSTYTGRAFTQVGADANRGDACMCQCFIDVTNTSNDKFKIQTNGGTYITWNGHSSQNETTVTAIRLGDT